MAEQGQDVQLEPTYSSLEDLPEAMNNREVWRERFRNIRTDSVV